MQGKELILATKPFAKEDRFKSWWYTLSTLLLLAASIAATIAMPYLVAKIALGLFTGLLMVRMFVIYHDFQHHAILHRSALANILMTVYGIYVLVPPSIWKRSHDYHHNHNSKLFSASIGSYPIASKAKFLAMTPSERRIYLAIRHPLTILAGYFTMFIAGMCLSSFISAPKKHYDSIIAILLHIAINILVLQFLGWQNWLCILFIPFMLSSALGAYLFYAQHNFPGTTFNDNADWKYEIAALESSSYMVMNPFMQWCTANIGYHHIHHLNSRIPFYRLPEAMAAIPELQKAKTTSLNPAEIAACFKLKIWDPGCNKMTGIDHLAQPTSSLNSIP